MKRRNLIALGIGLAALAGIVAWMLRAPPIAVETAPVTRGVFEQTVSEDGRTRVRERYVVSAPLGGRLERIDLKAGDPVEVGQPVALIWPAAPAFLDARTARELAERVGAAEAQQLRANAEVASASARRDQAQADFARAGKLAKEGFVAAAAREQAELSLRSAERTLEAANFAAHAAGHDIEQARAALRRYRAESSARVPSATAWQVVSPVTGRVLKVMQESEAVVPTGAPLVEIADPKSLEAVVDVLSQDSVSIRPGMPAHLEVGRGVAPLAARVRLVEPAAFTKISALGVEEQRVNVVLDFAEPVGHIEALGDAFRLEAHIVVYRAESALKVPVGALFRTGEGWAVFVLEDGRAVERTIETSRRNGVEALVDGGLQAGESVVVYPSDALRNGARVQVKTAGR